MITLIRITQIFQIKRRFYRANIPSFPDYLTDLVSYRINDNLFFIEIPIARAWFQRQKTV
jgi:hypothetical protein